MAKARSIGSIYAELTLKHGKFVGGLKTASVALGRFSAQSAKFAALSSVAVGAAMAYNTKKTLEMAGTLDDVAANTGLAVSSAMKLRKAYELGGTSADGLGKDIMKMQKAIGTAAAGGKDPFAKLGLSARELMDMNPEDAFAAIGASIMSIENRAARTTAAMEIFGKSGGNLINVFGQMEDASRFLGKMPEIMQKYAGAMARADDLITELPQKSTQFFTGFTAGVVGQMLPALESANKFDFTTMGENLGKSIAFGIEGLKDGTIFEIFSLRASAAFSEMGAELYASFASASDAAIQKLESSTSGFLQRAGQGFSDWLVNIAGSDEAKANWMEIKNRKILEQNAAEGYSPLGGGAPADAERTFAEIYEANMRTMTGGATDFADQLREAADTLSKAIDRRVMKLDTDARKFALPEVPSNIPPPANFSKIDTATSPESIVNDYQRRGLSLDAGGGQNTMQKTQQTVQDIFKLLVRNFRVTREPVF